MQLMRGDQPLEPRIRLNRGYAVRSIEVTIPAPRPDDNNINTNDTEPNG